MDLSKYRQLYISETQENLDELARRLVELEARPDHKDHIDTVFRLFHSIKGMSGTMGYAPMFELAHEIEELMDRVRRQTRRVVPEVIDALLAGVDRMGRWLGDVEAERLPLVVDAPTEALRAQIRALVEAGGSGAPEAVKPAVLVVEPGDRVVVARPAADCEGPAMRGFVLLRKLAAMGTVRSSVPDAATLRAGRFDGELRVALTSRHAAEKIERFVRLAPEWAEVTVTVAPAPPAPIAAPADDDDLAFVGDLDLGDLDDDPPAPKSAAPSSAAPKSAAPPAAPAPKSAAPPPASPLAAPDEDAPDASLDEPADAAAIVRPPPRRTIRVRTDWLDTLLDRVGDLLIVSQRMWALERESPHPRASRLLGELSRLLAGLHQDALSVRMTPLTVLTERLPRVVRDLARQAGKQATITIEGDDQRVDRAIIEGLDAPLTHIIRNAIEHGIEPADIRRIHGKPATGRLVLRCERVRDEIVVSMRDDGQGIDRRHLAERAVRLGLVDRDRATALAERDLCRLVCLPGLSIQDRAGHLAGRGVGMDAVADAATALGGRVEVESERGVGTTVRLHLPRTPGITRLLLVETGGQVYGIPLSHVRRTGLFDPTESAGGRVECDGEQLPLHPLCTLLGERGESRRGPGVVIAAGRSPFVVLVDRLVGQQDALQKPLGPLLERIEGLSGVTVDAEGHPVFVLDLPRMVEGPAEVSR